MYRKQIHLVELGNSYGYLRSKYLFILTKSPGLKLTSNTGFRHTGCLKYQDICHTSLSLWHFKPTNIKRKDESNFRVCIMIIHPSASVQSITNKGYHTSIHIQTHLLHLHKRWLRTVILNLQRSLAFHQSGYCNTVRCLLKSWYHRFWQSLLPHPTNNQHLY